MAKIKQQTIYNDYDHNQVKVILKKRKAKKRRRIRRLLLLVLIIILIVAFFMSDYSRLQTIGVSGIRRIDKQEVIAASKINLHEDYTFFTNMATIEKNVATVPLVKKVKVTKDLLGNVKIKIIEADPVGQGTIAGVLHVVDETGRVVSDETGRLANYVQRCPKLNGFDIERFKAFSKEFVKLPTQVVNQISDVNYAPLPVDETRCEFIMDDGKVLYLRYDDMAKQLKGNNYSFIMEKYPDKKYFDFVGKYVYPSN